MSNNYRPILVALILYGISIQSMSQNLEKLLKSDKVEKAIEYCNTLSSLEKQECYKAIGDYYLYKHNIEKARYYYDLTYNPFQGYHKIADYFFNNEEYNKAALYYELADNEAKLKLSCNKTADTYLKIARNYYKKGDSICEYSNRYIQEKEKYYIKKQDLIEKGDLVGAVPYSQKLNEYSSKLNDCIRNAQDQYMNSVEYFQLAANFYQKGGNQKLEKECYYRIAIAYYFNYNYESAELNFRKSNMPEYLIVQSKSNILLKQGKYGHALYTTMHLSSLKYNDNFITSKEKAFRDFYVQSLLPQDTEELQYIFRAALRLKEEHIAKICLESVTQQLKSYSNMGVSRAEEKYKNLYNEMSLSFKKVF